MKYRVHHYQHNNHNPFTTGIVVPHNSYATSDHEANGYDIKAEMLILNDKIGEMVAVYPKGQWYRVEKVEEVARAV